MQINPYTLFLILVLLVFGSDPHAAERMEVARSFVDRIAVTTNNMRNTIQSLQNNVNEFNAFMVTLNELNKK